MYVMNLRCTLYLEVYSKMNRRNTMHTPPDFKHWADNIVLIAQAHGNAREEIGQALEAAFKQGYSLGINHGWAIEQDKYYKGFAYE